MIKISDLGEEVAAAGLLMGLLKPGDTDGSVSFKADWFNDPISDLAGIGTRLPSLASLIGLVLGPGAADPPRVFPDAQWYSIPNPAAGGDTPFQVVVTSASDSTGEIGLGVLRTIPFGGLTVSSYAYLPLFSYSPSGAVLKVDDEANPCQIGVNITSPTPFQIQQNSTTVSFTALNITGSIYLNPQAYQANPTPPLIKVVFENLQGTPPNTPSTYTTLSELCSPDVGLWLAQVLVQSDAWLNVYAGPTFTVGDILEAANFLSRDYSFQNGNFTDLEFLVEKLAATTDQDAVSAFLWAGFSPANQAILQNNNSSPEAQTAALTAEFDKVINAGASIYEESRFLDVPLSPQTSAWITQGQQGAALVRLNRFLLEDAYSLELTSNPYQLNLSNLQGSASDIALGFLFGVLNALSTLGVPLLDLPNGGIYITALDHNDGSQDFGLRLVTQLQLTLDPDPGSSNDESGDESAGSSVAVDLCLGTWLTGETDQDNWMMRTAGTSATPRPGLSVLMLHRASNGALSFAPSFALTSIGLNIKGGAGSPLIDLDGYTLKGTDFRGYLNPGDPFLPVSQWQYGFGIRLDDLGFPLSPDAATGSSGNPVAQTLLSSGTEGNGGGADPGGDTGPVNPAFSAAVAWRSDSTNPTKINVQLFGADESPTDKAWLSIQRSFGPLYCQRLGIGWPQTNPDLRLGFLFDGTVTVGPLEVVLVDLSIQMPVTSPLDLSKYGLGLDGLDVSLNAGSVALAGGLIATGDGSYAGEATITAGDFTIAALGAFGTTDGATSLFIFGCLNEPLGGPPAFFVTGLSAGFGYNRQLLMPPQDQVTSFPLVAMASQGMNDPQAALEALIGGNGRPAYVPPMRGEYWVALGVNWTSFEVLKTTALLAVQFGKELEIDILGLTTLQLGADPDHPYVNLKLGIEATIKPDDGTALVTGILDSSSYIIDPACHVTGGFAFATWYGDNVHSGDFVLTVGGYHPSFKPPAWYPKVPRVGLNWNYSSNIVLAGDAYFALTPVAAMGGCEIDVTYTSSDLKAWLTAKADALVQWKPFFFDFNIAVSVGVSYKLDLLFTTVNFSVELGAGFEIWGPATGGYVYVDWYVISFSIPFGPSKRPPALNNWADFAALLPAAPATPPPSTALVMELAVATPASPNIALQALITGGNLTQNPDGSWNVRADSLAMTVRSPMPSNKFSFTAGTYKVSPPGSGGTFGMWQLGLTGATVATTVTIAAKAGSGGAFNPNANWKVDVISQGMPAAMWGTSAPAVNPATTPATTTLLDIGLAITAASMVAAGGPPAIPILNLEYTTIAANESLPTPIPAPVASAQQISTATLPLVITYLTDDAASGLRQQVLDALAGFGYDTGFDTLTPPGLTAVSPSGPSNVYVEFRNEVMLGTPAGISWPPSPTPNG